MNISDMTITELKRAVKIKEQIARLEAELAKLTKSAAEKEPAKKRRRMSAAGKARIAAAQKARWARIKGKK